MTTTRAQLSVMVIRTGVFLFPSFFLMDWFVYPDLKYTMLAIRLGVAVFLFAAQAVFLRLRERAQCALLMICFFVVSSSISLMCLVSGQGFESPYVMGILQMILVSTLFRRESAWEYGGLLLLIVAQHFAMLSFLPATLRGILINLFGIVVFAAIAVVAHHYLNEMARENRRLKGILPICAHCKKIRDDAGYWEEVATYIRSHSEAEFTHGICPDCMRALYPDLAEEVPDKAR
jgi:hypothetical protein